MDGARLRAALAAFLIAIIASLVVASPVLDTLRGLSIDILTALRWRIYGNAYPPESSAVVVFATSLEQSTAPFGTETLGARVRGFDRDFLRALALGARAGKVVLGQVQHQDRPLLPSPGQRAAVGFTRNIRALNVHTDADDVVRRLPLSFEVDGERVPAMAAELVGRSA